jgi:hypothetical protein
MGDDACLPYDAHGNVGNRLIMSCNLANKVFVHVYVLIIV